MANTNKMLIDATHPEETRVVTVHGSRVEEFDFESASRKPLRGNIYLAKVTRVEPSLQAAFVEYGGNRHGFLAFSEIHPDYYQIPVADRLALIEAEKQEEEEHHEREERRSRGRRHRGHRAEAASAKPDESVSAEDDQAPSAEERTAEAAAAAETMSDDPTEPADEAVSAEAVSDLPAAVLDPSTRGEEASADAPAAETTPEPSEVAAISEAPHPAPVDEAEPAVETADAPVSSDEHTSDEDEESDDDDDEEEEDESDEESDDDEDDESDEDSDDEDGEARVAQVGGAGDAMAELPERPRAYRRHYKIQEVIKRRQIILVQVVKEERGTKGAALTTYLSLAGRYSVLMPNTGRGGGISRKITSAADRKRLKEVVADLDVPEGMGIILRTAGASRTKPEIKRDFEYLMRLWESVRELTLSSTAPALVYEEGSLIKRAIRDLYNKELEEVLVAGPEAYREAKDFMRMLMPGSSKVVKPYSDTIPLFARYGIEQQLDAMFSTHVTLKSGGYLVINPTEALVSVDVNSGRATREHDIEDTALKTNLEAADEVARQVRLRDLAGLVVIDFIDMEEKRNNRAVEKRLNEALKNDRARIQVGRISPFGLLEMSRQRIRTGVLESSSIPCAHCGGSGMVRAASSVALHILRSIEEALVKSSSHNLVLRTRTEACLYILNQKRAHLYELETRFGVTVTVAADDRLPASSPFQLDRGDLAVKSAAPITGVRAVAISPTYEVDEDEIEDEVTEDAEGDAETEAKDGAESREAGGESSDENGRRRRRRRRRRGGRGGSENDRARADDEGDESGEASEDAEAVAEEGSELTAGAEGEETVSDGDSESEGEGEGARRRRRGRRGGRGRERGGRGRSERDDESASDERETGEAVAFTEEPVSAETVIAVATEAARETGPDGAEPPTKAEAAVQDAVDLPVESAPVAETAPEPAPAPQPLPEPVAVALTPVDPNRPKRAGWWSRTKAALTGE
ncbi:Rne/Rng family ribonuclease [Methylobacterium gnaphalii]|uniref:Ribonuclease E n=1 Tax=Methylobacterium gnaphalii TaxID=1010610 RepID=A0A512JJV0_9HYPH|nr:Rne/Rng family ribonuclease [Methylobacterium gnaphalii]GEP10231.1 ribonuclease E [Methylobacterium gnaphalii]GJD68587.1 Ribonuclease E [Methylobacterium gnaphalii]GLS48748.1 ribonuclease E [Methylobacterium gnaphalii]